MFNLRKKKERNNSFFMSNLIPDFLGTPLDWDSRIIERKCPEVLFQKLYFCRVSKSYIYIYTKDKQKMCPSTNSQRY